MSFDVDEFKHAISLLVDDELQNKWKELTALHSSKISESWNNVNNTNNRIRLRNEAEEIHEKIQLINEEFAKRYVR